MDVLQRWRARLSPIVAVLVTLIFLYWIWRYRDIIAATFQSVGILPLAVLVLVITGSLILSVFTFTILVQDKGYPFHFIDGYHSLNLSQLASMVPGKIWGFAGLAGLLWAKGISRFDSVIIILVNTVIMLSACAIVGFLGIVDAVGWSYSFVFLLPFVFLILGRNALESVRFRYFSASSPLPSGWTMLKVLGLGVIVWLIVSFSFTWFFYLSEGRDSFFPIWTVTGAYAAAYLGGFISLLAPSGIGVSEGLMTLILAPYFSTEKVLAVAVSFRIIHTFVLWCNILITLVANPFSVNQTNQKR